MSDSREARVFLGNDGKRQELVVDDDAELSSLREVGGSVKW